MNVAYVTTDLSHEWNSAEFRAAIPARALNRTNGRHSATLVAMESWAEKGPAAEYACENADVIVVQRGAMMTALAALRHWRERGKIVLADIDDGYLQIDDSHPAAQWWLKGQGQTMDGRVFQIPRPAIKEMAYGLQNTAGLTSPSKLILEDWKTEAGIRGAFVPNYLDAKHYRVKRTRSLDDDGTFWIGWGGSIGHLKSFTESGIAEALTRVLAHRPHVRLAMGGVNLAVFDRIPSRMFQKFNFVWRDHKTWPEVLANFDLAVIPLAGGFDSRRSWLKPLECSMMGVPWIASTNPAYESLTGRGVFVNNTIDEWERAILEIVDHGPVPNTVKYARQWAETQTIDLNIEKVVGAYAELARAATERA